MGKAARIMSTIAFTAGMLLSGNVSAQAADNIDDLLQYYPELSRAEIEAELDATSQGFATTQAITLSEALAEERAHADSYVAPPPGPTVVKYLNDAERVGDIFYRHSAPGHNGIFYSKRYFEHAPGLGKVVTWGDSRSYTMSSRSRKMFVIAHWSQSEGAATWAKGRAGAEYRKAFWDNKYFSGRMNCSQLVWAAYKRQEIDIDSNGGKGVYPRNIRDDKDVVSYQSY